MKGQSHSSSRCLTKKQLTSQNFSLAATTSRKRQETSRTKMHTRRGSDICNPSNNLISMSRPSCPIDQNSMTPTLHKVQTVDNLHFQSQNYQWNPPQEQWYNRPSDIFPPSIGFDNKQTASHTFSLHVTNASLSNDMDIQLSHLNEENMKLRRDNDRLREELMRLRLRVDEIESNCQGLRSQKERVHNQREELKKAYDRLAEQLQKEHQLVENTNRQKILYQEISEQLQNRLDILMQENQDLRKLFDKQCQKDEQVRQLEHQVERVRGQFQKLQELVKEDDLDWEMHKHMWVQEKEYYKEIIRKLEFQVQHQTNYDN